MDPWVRRKLWEWLVYVFFFLQFALLLVVVLGGIYLLLLRNSLPAIKELGLAAFFRAADWNPTAYGEPAYGLWSMLVSTALVTTGATMLVVVVGIASAAYLAEVARPWEREILKPAVEILAGIPSVVVGFLGLVVLGPIVARLSGLSHGLNALNGALLLAVMALPTVVTLAEDALTAVPQEYQEASLALGATRWQTLVRVKLRAAASGVMAAIILGVGRAVGETMTVLMATGNAMAMPTSLLSPVRTMTATIAIEMGEVAYNSPHYYSLYVIGLVLLLVSFVINLAADLILHRYGGQPKL